MAAIFVSYARKDNEPRPVITHEVTEAIDHFVAVYRYVTGLEEGDVEKDPFFIDRRDIAPGDRIAENIKRALRDSPVMLAFYSPAYFKSRYCFEEWRLFREHDKHSPNSFGAQKLLIPIETKPVEDADVNPFDPEVPAWVRELTSASGLQRNITSSILLDRDTSRLAVEIERLAKTIDLHLETVRGTSRDRRSTANIHVAQSPIIDYTLDTPILKKEVFSWRARFDWLPVCVLYAGGTVGMIRINESDSLHPDFIMAQRAEDIVQYLRPHLSDLPFDIHFFSLEKPIDSSNVSPGDWTGLARVVREQMNSYQGFVILHGTNTIAYTASALSFLLHNVLDRPVILTGSEVPISMPNTDALHNVENAIRAAAWQAHNGPLRVSEVCVFWNNYLLRGNRVSKKVASDRVASFHSPNMTAPLGTLAQERLDIEHSLVLDRRLQAAADPVRAPMTVLNAKVCVVLLYPAMDLDQLDSKLPDDLDGVLLLSYGPGNAPDDKRFTSRLKVLIANGTVVANITQCPYGRVELKLFETSATLFDIGVIDGDDMTLEAAYCKLMWALSKYAGRRQAGALASIKQLFQRNVAGEMTVSIYTLSMGSSAAFANFVDANYLLSDVLRFEDTFSPYDIADVFVRLEGFELQADAESARIAFFYGAPARNWEEEDAPVNLLVTFVKILTDKERLERRFDKNINITHGFRKFFGSGELQISVGVGEGKLFSFSSMRLVAYTRNRSLR